MISREQALQWAKEAGATIDSPYSNNLPTTVDWMVRFATLVAQHVREQNEKDAERYRWLRETCIKTVNPDPRNGPDYKELQFHGDLDRSNWKYALNNLGLDAAIDAAIRAQNEGEKA